jgi:hypothetical protein
LNVVVLGFVEGMYEVECSKSTGDFILVSDLQLSYSMCISRRCHAHGW